MLFPRKGTRKGEAALDLWSIPHVASGAALAIILESWLLALFLLVVYEVFEMILRQVKMKSGAGVFEYESWPNIVADVVVAMAGWALVRWLMLQFGVEPLA